MDLKEERDVVIKSILEMGHIPVGMEMFSAGDEEQWKIIKRQIDDCDYYVLIVANRYGSMDKGVSYTEKEYDYATSKGVPTLSFLLNSDASWPLDRTDKEQIKKEKLDLFKSKVKNKLIGFWSNKEDLYAKVCIALMKQFTVNPREGWIRANEGIDTKVTQEISRLSKENSDLRSQIQSLISVEEDDEKKRINETISLLKNSKTTLSYFFKGADTWEQGEPINLEQIFKIIAPEVLTEDSTEKLIKLVALITNPRKEDTLRTTSPLPTNTFNGVLGDLQALELLEPSKIKHSLKDTKDYWTISDYGKEIFKEIRIRKIKKKIESESINEEK